jgi:hypothetical protein
MDMKIFQLACLLAVLALPFPAAAAEEAPKDGACAPIATVYGQNICEADISPGAEIEAQIKAYTTSNGEDPEKALRGVKLTNLFGKIWEKALIHRYSEKEITPSKEEQDKFVKAMHTATEKQYKYDKEISDLLSNLMKENVYSEEDQAKLGGMGMEKQRMIMFYEMRGRMPEAMKKQVEDGEKSVADAILKSWKVKKLLYEEYGGRVIFQQSGLEPIDAFQKFFDETRKSKDVVLHDDEYDDVYDAMAEYLDEDHQKLPSDSKDVREYFASPTWLYDSGVAEEAHQKTKEMILAIPHEKAAPVAEASPAEEKKEEPKEEEKPE